MPKTIAMWSGPRNISTAMMRSWESRGDCHVSDEPLYAHYLSETGLDHPGRKETLASLSADFEERVKTLTGSIPNGKNYWYQTQMAHHLLPGMPTDWIESLTNCLLIREPREMLTSLIEFIPSPTVRDTGLPQQLELFQRMGSTLPVIDGRDVLADPPKMMRQLCDVLEVPFLGSMLEWAEGPRETDGAWASYWCAKVYKTTRFGEYRPKEIDVPAQLESVLAECEAIYTQLYAHRLRSA